jgi:hypothetical protein
VTNPISSGGGSSSQNLATKPFSATRQEGDAILADLLTLVTNLHKRFARYDEIDSAKHDDFVESLDFYSVPTRNENLAIDRALQHAEGKPWKVIPGTIREPVSYHQAIADDSAWGKAEGVVDAAAERVLAWMWCVR